MKEDTYFKTFRLFIFLLWVKGQIVSYNNFKLKEAIRATSQEGTTTIPLNTNLITKISNRIFFFRNIIL